ncbi:MAG: TIGR04255 family protein [bacterium]
MANKYPTLKNAPITEALIDIRVKLADSFDVNRLKGIYNTQEYPQQKERRRWEEKFEFRKGCPPISDPHSDIIEGFHYISSDKKQIVIAGLNGFIFSRLHPYEKWDIFRNDAYRLWQIYTKIAQPELITRVALRFINRIQLPSQQMNLDEYFNASPIVPEGLPQGLSSFLTRLVIPIPSPEGVIAILTHALEQPVRPKFLPEVILDIDVFKETIKGFNEKEAWELIDTLRGLKNDIFFKSINDKTKEMFK